MSVYTGAPREAFDALVATASRRPPRLQEHLHLNLALYNPELNEVDHPAIAAFG
jgi:hypothetical protein